MKSQNIPVFLLAAIACAGMICGAKSPKVSDVDRAKAAYIFMEAAARTSGEDFGSAYYMLSRAAELAPDDDEIAADLGKIIIYTGIGDSAEFENGYNAIKRLFFSDTKDVQNGYALIKVAQQLKRTDDAKAAYKALMDAYPGNADYALNYAGYRTMDFMNGDSTGPEEAAAIYDRLELGTGITDMLTLHRLSSLSVKGDTAEMVHQINRFTSTAPLDPQVNFYTGSMYDMIHMPDSAIVYYTAACLLDSTYGQAYLARAEHYLAVGDSARYDQEVLHALESPSLEFEAKYNILANYARSLYEESNRRETFLNLFGNMLDIHPGEASLHYLYGAYLASIDSIGPASEQFGYAMDLDPDEEVYARFRLQTAVEAGDTVAAIAAAESAISRFNDIWYPLSGASLLHLSGHTDQAVEFLKRYDVSRAENAYQKSLYEQTLGDILHAAGQNDSAYAAYDRALIYNPDNASVLNNLAYYKAVDGEDLDNAERYAVRALHAEPDNPTYIDTYAWVLFKQKDYAAARRQIDRALAVYDSYKDSVNAVVADSAAILFNELAQDELAEMITGETADGQLALENAEDALLVEEIEEEEGLIETPNSEIYDHAGDIYFMNGEPDAAMNFWREALLLDPENEKIKKKITHRAYFFD